MKKRHGRTSGRKKEGRSRGRGKEENEAERAVERERRGEGRHACGQWKGRGEEAVVCERAIAVCLCGCLLPHEAVCPPLQREEEQHSDISGERTSNFVIMWLKHACLRVSLQQWPLILSSSLSLSYSERAVAALYSCEEAEA